jgi:hypothetical protein
MKNALYLFAALAVICTYSCKRETKLPEILLGELENINQHKIIPLDSIVKSLRVIPIETCEESLLGGKISVYESKESFYIISNNKLFRFDKSGKFEGTISNIGRGPEEYLNLRAIALNETEKTLYLLDYNSQKILKYQFDGEFLKSINLKLPQYTFVSDIFMADNILCLSTSNNSINMEILSLDERSGTTNYISKKERDMLPGEGIMGNVIHSGQNNRLRVYNYFNDTVYYLNKGKMVPDFLINPGNYRITIDMLKNIMNTLPVKSSKISVQKIVSAQNIILILYSVTNINDKRWNSFIAIYDTNSGEILHNITISDKHIEYLSINSESRLFEGYEKNSLLMLQDRDNIYGQNNDSIQNPVIIKYEFR